MKTSELASIELDECYLRLSTTEDAKAIVQYFWQNRVHLKAWEPARKEGFFTLEGWQTKLKQLAILQEHKMAFYFLIFAKKNGRIIGIISFSHVEGYPSYSANVGYSLAERAQSKGIMTRALSASCQWLFDHFNLHRITAAYMPRNIKSAQVLKSVGFEIEGRAKNYLLINGRWEDHILTAKDNPNWQEQP